MHKNNSSGSVRKRAERLMKKKVNHIAFKILASSVWLGSSLTNIVAQANASVSNNTYLVAGEVLMGSRCADVLPAFETDFVDPIRSAGFKLHYSSICYDQKKGGGSDFYPELITEPASEAQLLKFLFYFLTHNDKSFLGQSIRFKKVLGIFSRMEFEGQVLKGFDQKTMTRKSLAQIKSHRFFQSWNEYKEEQDRIEKIATSSSYIRDFERLVGELFDPRTARYFIKKVLPRSNAIFIDAKYDYLLEDFTVVRPHYHVGFGRDCREGDPDKLCVGPDKN